MTPHQAYRRNAQSGWTRIEMLLAIYDAAILALDNGIETLQQEEPAGAERSHPVLRLRASQLCLLLASGVDANGSEISAHIRALCIYCMDQIAVSDPAAWMNARRVLATLREGFQGIREQGIQLEAEGVIAQLPQESAQTLLHV